MNEEKLIQKGWRGWLILYAVWALFSIFNSSNYQLLQVAGGQKFNVLAMFLNEQIAPSLFFASLCPMVYSLSYRYSPRRSGWFRFFVFHGLMLVVVFIGIQVLTALYMKYFTSPSRDLLTICQWQMSSTVLFMRIYSTVIGYFLILGSMTVLRWNRQKRAQKEKAKKLEIQASQLETQLANAKLQTLKRQLQPHFLFNALNSISSLVESKNNERAFKTIAQLSDLLRTSLELPDIQAITLQREIDFVRKYLAIELIRFPDRLKVETSVDPQCQKALIPALILQPLVENCIRHGVARQPEPVRIAIKVKKEEENIIIEIFNNQSRLPEDWSIEENKGVGIQNVLERLKAFYNGNFTFEMKSPDPDGVRVILILPFEMTGKAVENLDI